MRSWRCCEVTAVSSTQASGLASDTRSLDALRSAAARDPQSATREVARQFESLFMHELLKSMRQATPTSGLLDNEGSKLGTDMLDQQFATSLAGLRGGLSEAIARQLNQQMGVAPDVPSIRPQLKPDLGRVVKQSATAQDFVAANTQAARQAEASTGIPAAFMIAQAAHETGWGRKDIRMPDGSSSNNLFGIKAGSDWKGPVAEVTTTEYINGVAQKVKARFRAYADTAEAFADYARLMTQSPRYQKVVAQARSAEGFAQGLQKAGYATDPQYADKLSRVINTTLRLQRSLA